MKDKVKDIIKMSIIFIIAIIGTCRVAGSNIKLPMVENTGTGVLIIIFIVIFGFLFVLLDFIDVIYRYNKLSGD